MKITLEYIHISKLDFDETYDIFPDKWSNQPSYYDPYIHVVKHYDMFKVIYGYHNKVILNTVDNQKNSPFFINNTDQILCILLHLDNSQSDFMKTIQIFSYLLPLVKPLTANDFLYKVIVKNQLKELFGNYRVLPSDINSNTDISDIIQTSPAFSNIVTKDFLKYLFAIKPDKKTINLLSKLSFKNELHQILNFMVIMKFNKNYFKISCEILSELVYKENIKDLLTVFNLLQSFLTDPKIAVSQKTEKFITELYTLYYPSYNKKNDEIHHSISTWNLKAISLTPTPFFENKDIKLSAFISNKKSIQNLYKDFDILKNHLESLWEQL